MKIRGKISASFWLFLIMINLLTEHHLCCCSQLKQNYIHNDIKGVTVSEYQSEKKYGKPFSINYPTKRKLFTSKNVHKFSKAEVFNSSPWRSVSCNLQKCLCFNPPDQDSVELSHYRRWFSCLMQVGPGTHIKAAGHWINLQNCVVRLRSQQILYKVTLDNDRSTPDSETLQDSTNVFNVKAKH